MKTRYFALVLGITYLVLGVLSAIPKFQRPHLRNDPKLMVESGYGYWLGIFPVNVVHSLMHVVMGILGIVSFTSGTASRLFAQANTALFAPLTVMGVLPDQRFNTMFGMAPLWGPDSLVHAATALISGYFGFVSPREPGTRGMGNASRLSSPPVQTRSFVATNALGSVERRTVPTAERSQADPFGVV
ncbi:MAG: DUF4383 domain-containing protein [Chloroflexi bacterium]|nr:DUF4383 domain-containing protein [Chloroflexota bacterium]